MLQRMRWGTSCATLHDLVVHSFHEWTRHVDGLAFEHEERGGALLMNASDDLVYPTIGVFEVHSSTITISSSVCWFIDHKSCLYASQSLLIGALIVLAIACAVSNALLATAVCDGHRRKLATLTLSLVVFGTCTLVHISTTCADCRSLRLTLLHEIGHALGFDHSRRRGQLLRLREHHAVQHLIVNHEVGSIQGRPGRMHQRRGRGWTARADEPVQRDETSRVVR